MGVSGKCFWCSRSGVRDVVLNSFRSDLDAMLASAL